MAKQKFEKDKVLYEKRGHTAIITMNYPEKMNVYGGPNSVNLGPATKEALDDPEVWTLILTGAGEKAFCAGNDLSARRDDMEAKGVAWGTQRIRAEKRGVSFLFGTLPKPAIAAINGYCVGGGLELAMGCDIRIAAPHATFQHSEIKRGIIAGITSAKLPRLIPHNLALEVLLTARLVDAKEAYRIGLVNKVVPLKDLMSAALAMCDEINENAPLAVRSAKEVAWKGMDMTLSDALEECSRHLHEVLSPTEDSKEGIRAFLEKRKPVWKAR